MVPTYFRIREEGTQLHRPQEIPDHKISPTPGLQSLRISGPPTFSSGGIYPMSALQPSLALFSWPDLFCPPAGSTLPLTLASLPCSPPSLPPTPIQHFLFLSLPLSLHPSYPQFSTSSSSPAPPPMPSLPAQILSSELTSEG